MDASKTLRDEINCQRHAADPDRAPGRHRPRDGDRHSQHLKRINLFCPYCALRTSTSPYPGGNFLPLATTTFG